MNKQHHASRRELLAAVPVAMGAANAGQAPSVNSARPNIITVISDQFRWDCIGAAGLNPMHLTPNLDEMARHGTLFENAFCNQPVCAPARGSILTGQYPGRHGVWRNGIALKPGSTTLATTLKQAGYSTNHIGKWHLGGNAGQGDRERLGPVPLEYRGGYNDLWLTSNVLELTSHPYEGDFYDNDGNPVHFAGVYRTDFMTQQAQKFLRSAKSPFFLTLSYLEVHHQNDIDAFVPPKEYEGRFKNPWVPPDLRPLPGSWPSQLADYYACIAKMDETIGTIRKTLTETGLDRNTILMFFSDHACHFKTRNPEYKRTPHESSIHIPLVIEGPGFNRGLRIPELVSQVDLAPSLLAAANIPIPSSMQGRSFLPLLDRRTEGWRNEVYFEMTEFITGRGLRTPQFTYAAAAPKCEGWKPVPGAPEYVEYMLYDLYADPYQHTNMAGRAQYRQASEHLRTRLMERMKEAAGEQSRIEPDWFPYS